ncbi:hypothetical protein, partial [Vibrio vulnificus]
LLAGSSGSHESHKLDGAMILPRPKPEGLQTVFQLRQHGDKCAHAEIILPNFQLQQQYYL